jgi:putative copper export protein
MLPGVLPVSWDTVRLFLHVLAATIWVGGQLTLAALVPALRGLGASVPGVNGPGVNGPGVNGPGVNVPRSAARAFSKVAWPAFAVLLLTGVWNVIAEHGKITGSYQVTLIVKLVVVAVSGLTAWLHARATSRAGLAVFGALTGLSAVAALFLGVLLAG